jgi:iron complex outermembrane receptor protein
MLFCQKKEDRFNEIVAGSRTAPRTNTTTALPIDVISARSGNRQATLDKALQYKIPHSTRYKPL